MCSSKSREKPSVYPSLLEGKGSGIDGDLGYTRLGPEYALSHGFSVEADGWSRFQLKFRRELLDYYLVVVVHPVLAFAVAMLLLVLLVLSVASTVVDHLAGEGHHG